MKDMPSQQKKPQQMRVTRLENAVRESEMRYRRMFEAAQDGILIVNSATGKVEDANPYLLNLLGFMREDVLKKKVWQLYVDAKAAKQAFETLRKKKYIRMDDLPMQSWDGRLVPVESVSNVYRVGKRNVIQFNIRDISEQKVREESLRENGMRPESLFDNSPIPIWEEDFSDVKNYLKKIKLTGKPDDAIRRYIARHPGLIEECIARVRIINVNRACLALHNATDKSALLQGLDALVTEKSREALQEQIVAIAGGRMQLEMDSMVRTLDGQLRHVHVHWSVAPGHEDSLARVLVSTEDISQRIEAEDAQKVSERRFRSLIENSQDAIALLDATGKLIYESPSGLRITGYSAEERIGGSGFDLIHHDDLSSVRQHFGRVMQNPGADVRLQVRSRRKNGEWRWLDVTAVNLLADPAVGAIVVNYRDITERRQAEVALAEAEQTQNLLLESVGEGIHGLDVEGRIMFENAASLHMFGWDANEMLGQEAHALIHHHRTDGNLYPVEECPIYRTLRDGETRRIENEVFFRKDGSSFPVEYTCAAIKDKDGTITGVVVSFQDITERKRAEENIQQERVFSDAIINSMPGIFYLFDTQGRFLRWNENFETVSGYSAADIAGMHPMDFFEGAEKELVRQRIKQVFETGHSFVEANFASRNGSRAPYYFTGVRVELNGQICLLGVGVDITERKRAEKMLTNLSWAVNASGDIVFMTDKDGTIMSVNAQFTDLYGYAPEEVIGKTTPRILKSGKQGPEVYERFWQAITRGEMFRGQVVNKAKDGRLIPIEETVSPFFDERGEIAGFLAIQRNITARKQAEDKIKAHAADLEKEIAERKRAEAAERDQRALAESLRETAETLSGSLDYGSVLDRILDIVGRVVPHDSSTILLVEDGKIKLARSREYEGREDSLAEGVRLLNLSEPGNLRQMFESKQPVLIPDVEAYPYWKSLPGSGWLRSSIGVPMILHDEVIGFVLLDGRTPNMFTQLHAERLQTFSDQAAIAIHNARLYQQAQEEIAARRQAEANIQKQIRRLRSLREIDMAIGASFDMQTNLNTLLKHTTVELNVDAADILLFNPNLNLLEYATAYGFRGRAIEKSSLWFGEGHAGRAALQRVMVSVSDLKEHPEQFARANLLSSEGFACYFGMPLIAKGIVKGVLEVFHRSPLAPDQEWLDFLYTLAGQAAIAIEDAQLFSNLQRSNFELLHAYDATIEGWSRALDLRDKETEGHTQRVTEMAIRLGREFDLSDEELKYMRWGSLLHDIGKMGVPDNILFKEGTLTEEETWVMRKHPIFAYEMLSPIRYLKSAAIDIPYCHHEKWDGTGYPRGLKGEQIPFSARIFAVADVYDAITSDRPYRGKWEKVKAISYIREQAGIYFDPQVVEMFLRMVDAISLDDK